MAKPLESTILILALALAACESAKPFDYAEFEKRPGLFSGKDGEFVIYDGKTRR